MKIETERLELIVLDVRQLRLWTENMAALEAELNCVYDAEPMEDAFLTIVKGQLAVTEKDAANTAWHSFWWIIRKEDRKVIGSADFKAPPENGAAEIGYGLGAAYEHHGYMTETVEAMCRWAFSHPAVNAVIAETATDNLPSQRVLRRCGFAEYERGKTVWWKREKTECTVLDI